MTLLVDTLEAIGASGHTPDDVLTVRSWDGKYACTWEQFTDVSSVYYDAGYGAAEVPSDLIVTFSNGDYLRRWEYDGSEGWEAITSPPTLSLNPERITQVVGGRWSTVEELHTDE
jgi:hypothetical protein